MPITRKLVAQECSDDNQILKADSIKRYIVNADPDWQFLFGPNSSFTASKQVIKIGGELDVTDFSSVRFTSYLYNTVSGSIDNAAACTFYIYKVGTPSWTETLLYTAAGTLQYNQHFFLDVPISSLSSVNFDGGDTVMIEAVVTRLSDSYRDRVYINHLGIYDSFIRLKKEVDYLDLTKLDE